MIFSKVLYKDIDSELLTIEASEIFGDIDVYKEQDVNIYMEATLTIGDNNYIVTDRDIKKNVDSSFKYTDFELFVGDAIQGETLPLSNVKIKIIAQVNVWDLKKDLISDINYDWFKVYRDHLRRFVGVIDVENPPTKTQFGDDILLGAIGLDKSNNKVMFYTTTGWVPLNDFIQQLPSFYTKLEADEKFIDIDEIKNYYTKSEADSLFAEKEGNSSIPFNVGSPTIDTNAINKGFLDDTLDELKDKDILRLIYWLNFNRFQSSDTSGEITAFDNTSNDLFEVYNNSRVKFKKAGTYLIRVSMLQKCDEVGDILNIYAYKRSISANEDYLIKKMFYNDLDQANWSQKELIVIVYFDVNDEFYLRWDSGSISIWEDGGYSSTDIIRLGGSL